MRELWNRIAYTSGARIYAYTIGFLILTITARWLGPEGRGIIASLTTWAAMFATLGDLSLGQVALHHATDRRDEAWLKPVFGSLALVCALVTVLGWALAVLLYLATDGALFRNLNTTILIIGFLSLPALIWERYGSSLLMAEDKLSIYNKAQVVGRTTGLVLVCVAWFLDRSVASVLFAMLVSQAITAGVGVRHLYRRAQKSLVPQLATTLTLIRGGIKLHWNTIGTFLIMTTDILIVNHYHGLEATGQYQMAVQLINIILIVPTSASMMLYGQITKLGIEDVWAYYRKVVIWLTVAIAVLCIVSALVAPFVIPLVLGERFVPSVPYFQILLLAVIGMSLSVVMAPQWISRGWFWQTSAMTVIIGAGNLTAGLILIPIYGIYAAVWTTVATYAISFVVHGGVAVWCERRYRQLAS